MVETTKNISEWDSSDGFKCEKCGIEIVNYVKLDFDISDDILDYHARNKITNNYDENGSKTIWGYVPKYCPECGRKII